MADTALADAIASAGASILADGKKNNGKILEGTPAVEKSTPADDEVVIDKPSDSDDSEETVEGDEGTDETDASQNTGELTEDQVKEAQTLYRILLDPSQRGPVIAALAQQAGVLNPEKPITTKKEEIKAKKDITKILTEALPEFPALAEKLSGAIDEILEQEREEHQQEMAQIHLDKMASTIDTELNLLAKETKGESRKLEAKMTRLSEEMLMGPNMTLKQYVRNLYLIASEGKTVQRTSAQISDKIRRNANNAPDRLKGTSGSEGTNSLPTKKMNLNDSVKWAIEQAYNNGRK